MLFLLCLFQSKVLQFLVRLNLLLKKVDCIHHIFICYISYLLLSLLEIKIKKIEISGVEALEKLSTSYRVHLKNKKTKVEFTKTVILNKIQEKIIKTVNKKLIFYLIWFILDIFCLKIKLLDY